MATYVTKRGELEVGPDKLLTFPFGLIGLPQYHSFFLHSEPGPFVWLLSTEDPQMGLPVINPRAFKPDYAPIMPPAGLEVLKVRSPQDLVYLSVVVIPERIEEMRTNLAAPLAINPDKRLGLQAVLSEPSYPTRYQIYQHLWPASSDAERA